ncbi:hypothetical protein ABZ725_27480 [Streptomyces sp. NPDC006872]|uniref:hypothetical protein n=1 Tax=Streptomyces sp. NPDC006872 TaxID=3155720 RepID=UPI0033CCA3E4
MPESTGSAVSGETASAGGAAPPRRSSRRLAAGVAATSAGPFAAGLQGDLTIAVISAAPGLVLGLSFFFGVVCPAVWSRKAQRQKAALNVMNSLLGRTAGGASATR